MMELRRLARDLGGIAAVSGLMLLVTFLPPDTSLREVEANRAIRACVPTRYPPLVTGDLDAPGIDIELLGAVADRLGVDLLLTPIDAMGRDFNPRNWAINRGKCQIIAGGVVDSDLTRSFLDTGPAYAATGWAVVAPEPLEDLEGRRLGALTMISGLDRIALSSYLRRRDVAINVLRDAPSLERAIVDETVEGGITEALLAGSLAAEHGWWMAPLPDALSRYNLVFGIWKGDLTLKREIVETFRHLEADGTVANILARYGAAPMAQDGSLPTL